MRPGGIYRNKTGGTGINGSSGREIVITQTNGKFAKSGYRYEKLQIPGTVEVLDPPRPHSTASSSGAFATQPCYQRGCVQLGVTYHNVGCHIARTTHIPPVKRKYAPLKPLHPDSPLIAPEQLRRYPQMQQPFPQKVALQSVELAPVFPTTKLRSLCDSGTVRRCVGNCTTLCTTWAKATR